MKNIKLLLGVAVAAMISSCAVTVPYKVTNNPIGSKTGVSSTISILSGRGRNAAAFAPQSGNTMYHGLVFNKKFGIVDAAKNGKISKIGAVDFKITSYVFFTKQEFVVSGE